MPAGFSGNNSVAREQGLPLPASRATVAADIDTNPLALKLAVTSYLLSLGSSSR